MNIDAADLAKLAEQQQNKARMMMEGQIAPSNAIVAELQKDYAKVKNDLNILRQQRAQYQAELNKTEALFNQVAGMMDKIMRDVQKWDAIGVPVEHPQDEKPAKEMGADAQKVLKQLKSAKGTGKDEKQCEAN